MIIANVNERLFVGDIIQFLQKLYFINGICKNKIADFISLLLAIFFFRFLICILNPHPPSLNYASVSSDRSNRSKFALCAIAIVTGKTTSVFSRQDGQLETSNALILVEYEVIYGVVSYYLFKWLDRDDI